MSTSTASPPMTDKPLEKRREFADSSDEHLEVADERGEEYQNNVNARLQNPLWGLSREGLSKKVAHFASQRGMEHERALFEKAAILAQHPDQFEDMTELDDDDRYHIRRETTNKWSQPFPLYFTVAVCSLSAAVQGWDQTGSNGANLGFPQALGIDNSEGAYRYLYHDWLVGVINAGPYLACVGLSCWISDPLNNWLGRRGVIFFCGIFCTLSVIGSAFSQTWQQLFITRLLLGIGMGPKASTTPIYAAENVPANIRGGLVMSWQLWTAFGIFLGFCANMAMADVGKNAWRFQLGSAFLPAVPMTMAIYFCPESPRWLMKKGNYPKAFRSFCRLRNSRLQAARDMFYCWAQLEEENKILGGTTYFGRVRDLFVVPRIRRATLGAFIVMLAQQMCGINIIAFYSSTIFVEAGYTPRNALKASLGFGAVNFLFAFPAVFTIDTFGRRNLLLCTFPNMAWTLLAAGLCFLIPKDSPAHLGLIALFIFLFAAFYSPGEGPVPFTYSAEVFPLTHRELGMGFAVATCLGFAALLSITFPAMVRAMTTLGGFCFYAGLNVIALVLIFFFVPETAQRTLEELDAVFAVPTMVHAKYQLNETLPYFIKRYIKRDKTATLRPLYDFSQIKSITKFEKGAGH